MGQKGIVGDPGLPGPHGRNGTDGLPGDDVRKKDSQLTIHLAIDINCRVFLDKMELMDWMVRMGSLELEDSLENRYMRIYSETT